MELPAAVKLHTDRDLTVTFGGGVKLAHDFATVDSFVVPELVVQGETPMGEAVLYALDALRNRKNLYKSNGVLHYRPWVVLLTDGAPTDEWHEAAVQVKEGEAAKHFSFFAVGVQAANMEVLRKLSVREPLRLVGLGFGTFFRWLSNSLGSVSRSRTGEEVPLINPRGENGWAWSASAHDGEDDGAGIADVAVIPTRCAKDKRYFGIRVEQRRSGDWQAAYAAFLPEMEDDHARHVPVFSFASDYPGCPSCRARSVFKCSCARVGCWDGRAPSTICPWCEESVQLTEPVESFEGSGG